MNQRPSTIYLNYAALCPPRPEVEQEMARTLAELGQRLYSEAGVHWYRQCLKDSRRTVAEAFHIPDSATIAFTANASLAHYLALSAIHWQPGDVLVTSTHENPSIIRQLHTLTRRGVKVMDVHPITPSHLLTALESLASAHPIKAVVMSHVSHVDGRLFPISDISALARANGFLFLVDGAQAAGHIPVDVDQLGCDSYFFPGHKWCRGPLGTGVLIVSDQFCEVAPGIQMPQSDLSDPRASLFEVGTQNIGLIAGLARACALAQESVQAQQEPMESRRSLVATRLHRESTVEIMEWEGPHAPGIVTFRSRRPVETRHLASTLEAEWGIVVKAFPKPSSAWSHSTFRLSWLDTTPTEELLWALDHICAVIAQMSS
ncbi:MAG: aminotransferase class V-fold PLP-dependent enzyme [Nitrospirae bacterium]|nr:MAG: aminotransferase class V-fold PLP-dependent enzyme [Nitrospirota bacterium]